MLMVGMTTPDREGGAGRRAETTRPLPSGKRQRPTTADLRRRPSPVAIRRDADARGTPRLRNLGDDHTINENVILVSAMTPESKLIAPKQDRSRRTLDRIVRASIEILEEQGGSGLTVQAIVRRAGASVGSFYARFAGKDDLVDYLGDRVWREAAERWDRALSEEDWSRLDLPAVVRASVRLIDRSLRSRATVLESLGNASGSGESAFQAFQQHVLAGLERLLAARGAEIAHSDPILASRIGLMAVQGVLSVPVGAPSRLTEAGRAAEAERLLLGYLTDQPSGDRTDAGGGMDFFDIWG